MAGLLVVGAVLVLERRFESTTRSARSPSTARAEYGARSRWACSPTAPTATDGTASPGPVRGLLYGDAGQFVAQLIGVTVIIIVVFGLAMAFFMVVERTIGNRVPVEVEWIGPRRARDGKRSLPAFVVRTSAERHIVQRAQPAEV